MVEDRDFTRIAILSVATAVMNRRRDTKELIAQSENGAPPADRVRGYPENLDLK